VVWRQNEAGTFSTVLWSGSEQKVLETHAGYSPGTGGTLLLVIDYKSRP